MRGLLLFVVLAVVNAVHVTIYRNGESTDGVQVEIKPEDVTSGLTLAQHLSTFLPVDGIIDGATNVKETVADRVYNGNGIIVENYDQINENERLYLVAPDLLFVWPFVEFGHKVSVESSQSPTQKPIVLESFNESPRVFLIHDLFTNEEADGLVNRILEIDNEHSKLQRSYVGHENGLKKTSTVRTSENAFDSESEIAVSLNKRAFDLLGIGTYKDDMADGLQLLRYQQKQAYIAHTDYFGVHTSPEWNWDPKYGGSNRFATVFLYLSNVTRGGQTVFPLANMPEGISHAQVPDESELSIFEKGSWEEDMAIKCHTKLASYPRKTHAVLFYSQKGNGALDPMSEHGGCPVLDGTKAANLWVWNKRRYGLDGDKISVTFQNNFDHPIQLFWSTTFMQEIDANSHAFFESYDNHEWTFKDLEGNELLVHRLAKPDGTTQTITVPQSEKPKDEL
uniref:Secreted protein n=1 Tax=Thraustotheca clavata TaxID=74557 RepID=A0A0A7CMM9_9STRA|nr:secreted protein [Thraustotheca clavata]